MKAKFFVAIATAIIIFGGVNYYIGLWNLKFLNSINIKVNRGVYWIIFGVIAMSYVIARAVESVVPASVYNALSLVGSYWLGIMSFILIILVIAQILIFGNRIFSVVALTTEQTKHITAITGLLVLSIMVAVITYGAYNASNPKIKKYDISIDKNAGGMKQVSIAMVSDIHLGTIIRSGRLEKMVSSINELKPDLILLAGDIIDEDVQPFRRENLVDIFKQLKAPLGVYAIRGNHEYMGKDENKLQAYLDEAGIKTLVDEGVKIKDSLYVFGRDDASVENLNGRKRMAVADLLKSADRKLPIILLDHQPNDLWRADDAEVDLQLSGHTHRGQFFPYEFVTGKIFELDWGYIKKNYVNVIVSSGFGTWGPPIRVASDSEIVNVRLHFTK